MGFLDFIFGDNTNNRKRRSGFYGGIYNKQWLEQWNKLLTVDLQDTRFYYIKPNKLRSFKSVFYKGYQIEQDGIETITLSAINTKIKETLQSESLCELIILMAKKVDNLHHPAIQESLFGLMRIKIFLHAPSNNHSSLFFLFYAIKNNATLVQNYLESLSSVYIKNKLYLLLQIYIELSPKLQEELQDEWIKTVTTANNIVPNREIPFFKLQEEVLQVAKIKYLQKNAWQSNDQRDKLYADALWNNIGEYKNNPSVFLIYIYYLRIQYNQPEVEKKITSDWLKKMNIDADLLQRVILVFNQYHDSLYFIGCPYLVRVIRNFLKKNILDYPSYQSILEITPHLNAKQYQQVNELLFNKQKDLSSVENTLDQSIRQNINPRDFIKFLPYLHSGFFLLLHENNYTELSDFRQFQQQIVLVLSQVTNALVIKEKKDDQSNEYSFQIGNNTVTDIKLINQSLQMQKIPYQMISFYVDNKIKGHNRYVTSKFIHNLLLTKQEYNLFVVYAQNNNLVINNIFGHAIFPLQDQVPSISNHLKDIKDIIEERIGDQVFINDFRWKEIKTKIVDHFANKKIWYEIMNHIITYTGSVKPSVTWYKTLQKHRDTIGNDDYELGMNRLLFDVLKNLFWFDKNNIKALRGMIWATTLLDEFDAIHYLEKLLLKTYYRHNNMGTPLSISGGSSCMAALMKLDTAESYDVLKTNSLKTDYERFRNQLDVYIDEFETKSHIPIELLLEKQFEDFGFIDGHKSEKIANNIIADWKIKDKRIISKWVDNESKKLPRVPDISRYLKDKIRNTTAKIEDAIYKFDKQMNEIKFVDINWNYSDWHKRYFSHPLVSYLIDNYLWIAHLSDKTELVFITKNQQIFDSNNNEVEISQDAQISPYHPTDVNDTVHQAWYQYFAENKMIPAQNYFYHYIDSTSEFIDNFTNSIKNNLPFGNKWINTVGRPSAIIRELELQKIIVVLQTNEQKEIDLSFYQKPPKISFRELRLSQLKKQIPNKKISDKTIFELYNEIAENYLRNSYNFRSASHDILKNIAYFRNLDALFKQIHFDNLTYHDLSIQIDGTLNHYTISLVDRKEVKIKNEKRTTSYFIQTGFKPRKNYPAMLGIPWQPDSQVLETLWAIEQLTNDANTRVQALKKSINR